MTGVCHSPDFLTRQKSESATNMAALHSILHHSTTIHQLHPTSNPKLFGKRNRLLNLRNGRDLRPIGASLNVEAERKITIGLEKLGLGRSKEVIEDEARVVVGTYARTPVVLVSGKGCKLYDAEGKEYLDLGSGIAVNALGHGDEDWIQAVVEQANVLTHVSNLYYNLPQIKLAERLVGMSFADRVFFTNSGTEANEAAIKFSRKFQRHSYPDEKDPATEFVAFSNSFHGRTMGALALTSKENYRTPFQPVMPGVTFVEYGNIEAAKEVIRRGKTAAVFVEPIQGEGGIYSATKQFLQFLRDACDEAGALLVYDEVQCGLGRTGHIWAHEAYGVYPDIMTLAKPLAGGLPIGAVLVTERVASSIEHGDHGSTFAGSPLICSAALAVVDKITQPQFLSSVSEKGQYLKKLLTDKIGSNPHVKEIRGQGLLVGIELDISASPLVDACREAGLLVLTAGKGNVVRIVPPLIITKEELECAARIISESFPALDTVKSNFLTIQPQLQSNSNGRHLWKTDQLVRKNNDGKMRMEKSKDVMEAEAKIIVGTYARTPVVLVGGKGCNLYDLEGKEYLDLGSGIAVNALGHGDEDWVRAVVEQASILTHVSNIFYNVPQIELAKKLVATSFADKVFFTNSGTEANEAAIKFSRKFQRHSNHNEKDPATEFIAFSNCFHGRTIGALALTHKEHYRMPFQPIMPGVTFVEYGNIEATKEVICRGKTAAVFIEPIQGEGGIYSATKQFLQFLREACDEAGALLVYDEVQCGLGRTGHLWAHEAYGVYPDIMTLAKPLAGGLPIGAVLVTERVASAIEYGDHGSTFAGSPLVCNAALAVVDKISQPGFLSSVSEKGEYLKKLLTNKLGSRPHVKEIRGQGLIVGIELDVSASPLVDACREAGLLILTAGKGNVVRIVPPLIITKEEIERAANIISECLLALEPIN